MRKALLVILFLCISCPNNTNAQTWEWAKSAGGNTDDKASSIAADASGNVYVTGYFTSPQITFGSFILSHPDGTDKFLVKYDASGAVAWAINAGGGLLDLGNCVTVDVSGNVYLAGSFSGPSVSFNTTTLTNPGGGLEYFLVKFDPSGAVIWAKNSSISYNSIQSQSIVLDHSGNIYMTGYFYSDSITIGTSTFVNADTNGTNDLFIAKFDPSGNLLWAKSAGGSKNDYAWSITTDASGNAYVAGWFYSPSITFGSTTLVNATSSGFGSDIYIAKFDASGNVVWAKSVGGTGDDNANAVATDLAGNIYLAGMFYSPAITFDSITLTNTSSNDLFLVKYDPSGNALWAKSATNNNYCEATSVNADAFGDIYLSGYFTSATLTLDTVTINNLGSTSIFLARYDTAGNAVWAQGIGLNGGDFGYSVTTDHSGNIYMAGYFDGDPLAFGNDTVQNASSGNYDMFACKYHDTVFATGIKMYEVKNTMLYPNPSSTSFNVLASGVISNIIITNLTGQTVYTHKYNSNHVQVDVADLPTGMYLVRINGSEVRKFVKE